MGFVGLALIIGQQVIGAEAAWAITVLKHLPAFTIANTAPDLTSVRIHVQQIVCCKIGYVHQGIQVIEHGLKTFRGSILFGWRCLSPVSGQIQ
jgi:hypothetical protein